MKLTKILTVIALLVGMVNAQEFIPYKKLTKQLKKEMRANGNFATIEDVKFALKSKDWVVADVRTKEEWAGAHIKGSNRVGRQNPEKQLALYVLDDDDNFIKKNVVVVCNSASRAAIEAQTFKQMGFDNVKIFGIYKWIDKCNPVVTNYTVKKDKGGSGIKFGQYFAEHCHK